MAFSTLAVLPQVLHRDLFIVLSMLLLVIYAVSRVIFPKLFAESIAMEKLFGFRIKEDLGSSIRPFSTEHIYFTALYSFNLSFVILFLVNGFATDLIEMAWLQFSEFWQGLLYWLLCGIAINLLVYLKYLLIALISWLFNATLLTSRHFIDLINASSLFFIFIALILAIGSYRVFLPGENLQMIVLVTVLIFFFYRSMLLYIRLIQLSPYSKLYIFSYICSTELIPLLVGVKFLTT